MRLLYAVVCSGILATGCGGLRAIVSPPAARPATAKETVPLPPPVLSPEVGQQEEERLSRAASARIEGAERIVRQIDQARLAGNQQEMLSTVQSFLAKAKEAISAKDFQRAYNLADKAQLLAEELAKK